MSVFQDPKQKRQVDEDFVDWIRNQKCLVCQSRATDPAHLDTRGSGGSDYTCVPLCRRHHREQEDSSLEQFEEGYKINLWKCSHRLLRRYLADGPIAK